MKRTFLLPFAFALAAFTGQAYGQETTCDTDEPIVFAGFNWDSAAFHNAVARYVLEKGYGCKTDEIPGATIPLFNGMLKGDVDVAMEIWTQSVDKLWTDKVKSGHFVEIGTNLDDAVQGVFVPKYLVEGDNAPAKGLRTVADLARFSRVFKDPEQPNKGRFYNCVLGWSCADINSQKLKAYGLSDLYVDVRPGAGAAVTSAVESALRRKKPVVFYYWTPSWLIGKYQDQLVMLDEPAFDAKVFEAMRTDKNPKAATAYAPTVLKIGVRKALLEKSPLAASVLGKYHTTSADVSAMLSYMQSEDKTAEQSAVHFLKTHPKLWRDWVSKEAAKRIEASL